MGTSPLSIDVYVSPMRPYNSPDPLGEGEAATWAPSSSTLIAGPTEGILIDALLTFGNADEIAAWAKRSGKKITGVYITHGHSDHWLGLARLLEHFPGARRLAARATGHNARAAGLPSGGVSRRAGTGRWPPPSRKLSRTRRPRAAVSSPPTFACAVPEAAPGTDACRIVGWRAGRCGGAARYRRRDAVHR